MKKPVKIALWVVGGLLALVVLLVLALPLWIGPVVTGVANGVAPALTGTEFKLEKFALNPYSGRIGLVGLKLSNPKGYDEKTAVSVKSVDVSLDFCSLFSKKIHIHEVVVQDPFVSYVFDDAGSNNFERILGNVNAKLGGGEEEKVEGPKKEEAQKDGKKLVIDRLCINGTWVKYRMIKLPIPVPTLTNIGGGDDPDGASPDEVKETVWKAVSDKFTSAGGLLGSAAGNATDALKGLVGGGTNAAADATKKTTEVVGEGAKKATETAKAATEAVSEGAKKAADAAGDAAKAAAEGLKKLNPFGK